MPSKVSLILNPQAATVQNLLKLGQFRAAQGLERFTTRCPRLLHNALVVNLL